MTAALEISNLQAWYGESHILHNVNMTVQPGEVVTLLGRNGAGRTTTLRAIMGLTGARKGSIKVNGKGHRPAHAQDRPPRRRLLPGRARHFSSLSTEENLMLPPHLNGADKGMSVAEIYAMFPNLKSAAQPGHAPVGRRAADAGGGAHPAHRRAPAAARRNFRRPGAGHRAGLARMITTLKAKGYTIVMVEQNFRFAAPLADRFYVMEHGQIVETFVASELSAKMPVLTELLGV
jgi:branched-chain amino acid transport system ATP-binding protein